MNIEYMIKGMMVGQYLEMIDRTEKQLEELRDGLSAIICPDVYEDVCDDCVNELADRVELN